MSPSLNEIWRSIVLRGANVASYKFALAESLIELANVGKTFVTIEDLSVPFSLVDMAKTYRAEKLEKDNGTVFEDDFTKDEFDRTIEKNNLDRIKSILYPIKNFE